MKLSYFKETDTLYLEFKSVGFTESRDMDENTIVDMDKEGNIVAITMEHASKRTDVQKLTLSGIAA